MDWIAGARAAQAEGVTRQTHDKYARSWRNWLDFQERCGISNPYLDELKLPEKVQLLGAFMHASRVGTFNPRSERISGTTARKAISHISATIVSSGRPDPSKNTSGKTDLKILRQAKAYKDKDPPTKHQKALPPVVYEYNLQNAKTPKELARATLLAAVLFWGCRSCEYSLVPEKERKTRPIRVCDVEFRIGARVIPHDNPDIFKAETVVIGFGPQKSGNYDDQIPMDATTNQTLCPKQLWAQTITRLKSYPGFDPQWPVYIYYNEKTKKFENIKSSEIGNDIKKAVKAIGKDILGFGPDEVGTHSNRASLAMQLYLQHVPPYTIMLIGRWRSDAFLAYIEKQCREFTKGMSQIMLSLKSFYQLPEIRKQEPPNLTQKEDKDKKKPKHNHRNAQFIHFGRLNALRSHCH